MRAFALVLAGALVATPAAGSPRQEADQRALSQYLELPSEQVVVRRTTLLSTSLVLDRPASVLFQSDGTFRGGFAGSRRADLRHSRRAPRVELQHDRLA